MNTEVPFTSMHSGEPFYPPSPKKKRKPVPEDFPRFSSTAPYPDKPSPSRSARGATGYMDPSSRKRTSKAPSKGSSSGRKRRESELLLRNALEQMSAKLSKSEAQRKSLEDRLTTLDRRPSPLTHDSPLSSAVLQQQATTQAANTNAREYLLRLQNAERELDSARRAVRSLEDSKEEAERETRKARAAARKLRIEHQMLLAREQGWQRGLQEGRNMAQDLLQDAVVAAASQYGAYEEAPDQPLTIYSSDDESVARRQARSRTSRDGHARSRHRRTRAASLDSSHAAPSEVPRQSRAPQPQPQPQHSHRSHAQPPPQIDQRNTHVRSTSQQQPHPQPQSIPTTQPQQPKPHASHSKSERGHRTPNPPEVHRLRTAPESVSQQPVSEPPPIEPIIPPQRTHRKRSKSISEASAPSASSKYESAIQAAISARPAQASSVPYVPMPAPTQTYAGVAAVPGRPPLTRLQTGLPGRSTTGTLSSAGTGTVASGADLSGFPTSTGSIRFPPPRESEERIKQERALSEKHAELQRIQADLERRSNDLRQRELQRLEREMDQKSREMRERERRNLGVVRESDEERLGEGGSGPYGPLSASRERERRRSVEQWRQNASSATGSAHGSSYRGSNAGRRGPSASKGASSSRLRVQSPSSATSSSSSSSSGSSDSSPRVLRRGPVPFGANERPTMAGTMTADAAFGHPGTQFSFISNGPSGPYSSGAVAAGEEQVSFPQPNVPNIVTSGGPSFPQPTVPNIVSPDGPSFPQPGIPNIVSPEGPSFPQPNVPNIVPSGASFPQPTVPNIVPSGASFPQPTVPNIVPSGASFPEPTVPNIVPPSGGHSFPQPTVPNIVPSSPSFPQPTIPNFDAPTFPDPTIPTIIPPPGQYSSTNARDGVSGGKPIRSATYPTPRAGSATPGGMITPRMNYQAAEFPPGVHYPSPPGAISRSSSQTQPLPIPMPMPSPMPVIPGVNTNNPGVSPNRRSMSLAPTPSSLASSLPAANFPSNRALRHTSTRRRNPASTPGAYETSSSSGSSSGSSTSSSNGSEDDDGIDHFDEVTRRNTQANTGYTPRAMLQTLPPGPTGMGMLSR